MINQFFDQLQSHSSSQGSKAAIESSHWSCTYQELWEQIELWTARLQPLKDQNNVLALICSNEPVFLFILLACLRLKIPFIPLDPSLKGKEIETTLRFSEITHCVMSAECAMLHPELSSLLQAFCQVVPLSQNDATIAAIRSPENTKTIYPPDCSVVQFSSGSTGNPKGMLLTANAVAHRAITLCESLTLSKSEITLCSVPLSHSHGMDCLALPTLFCGGTLLLQNPSHMTPPFLLELLEKKKVTFFSSIPQIYEMILKLSKNKQTDLSALRLAFCGSAALSEEVAKDFFSRYGIRLYQGYGLAEIGVITLNKPDDSKPESFHYGSIGKPMLGMDWRLDQDQQLIVKSKSLFIGYLKDETQTKERIKDGELYTQDLMQIDQYGNLFITGRMNECIHSSGQKVFPLEIERCVSRFPEISHNAVIGVKDALRGEVPVLFIELNAAFPVSDPEALKINLIGRLRTELSDYKIPARVHIWPSLPKSPIGKVLRSKLKEVS